MLMKDPLLPNDWREDPWDNVSVLPESLTEELAPTLDGVRGPLRLVAIVVVAVVLLLGLSGWWVVRQLNPSGPLGKALNFTVNEGDTVSSVAGRLEASGVISNA